MDGVLWEQFAIIDDAREMMLNSIYKLSYQLWESCTKRITGCLKFREWDRRWISWIG
jgi:hypothetical protein